MSYLTRTLWLSTLFIFTFCGGNHVQKYAWQDSKGFQYLTVEYKGHFSAESISPNKPGFAFLPVEASPFLAREGYAQKTFQVVRFLGEARPQALIKPIVYLIGETHIGKSQIRVAKELKRLIETHRIDAILLEQPEDKKFNWELFKPLTQNPRRALVALQRRMLRDSKGSFNYNYGRYDKYFTNVKDNASFKKAIMSVAKIYGIPTAKRLIDSLTRQSRHIKNDYKRYKDGKYISAADYYYIYLNLTGFSIPFHNIESVNLRDAFLSSKSKDLNERDAHMTKRTDGLVKNKGYQRMILICGAKHLDSLQIKLKAVGLDAIITYDSTKESYKEEMAVLKRPDFIMNLTRKERSQAHPNIKYNARSVPPSNVIDSVRDVVHKGKTYLPADTETVMGNFRNAFEEQVQPANRQSGDWAVRLPFESGISILFKSSREAKQKEPMLTVLVEKPIRPSEALNVGVKSSGYRWIDLGNFSQLKKINKHLGYDKYYLLEEQSGSYVLYTEHGVHEGSLDSLSQKLDKELGRDYAGTVYVDMRRRNKDNSLMSVTEEKSREMAENFNYKGRLQGRHKRAKFRSVRSDGGSGAVEMSRYLKQPIEAVRVENRIEKVKDWFRVKFRARVRSGGRLQAIYGEVLFRTREAAEQFILNMQQQWHIAKARVKNKFASSRQTTLEELTNDILDKKAARSDQEVEKRILLKAKKEAPWFEIARGIQNSFFWAIS